MTDDRSPHADEARGQEGREKWAPQNGLPNVKVGSHPSHPLRHRGVGSWKRWTKRVPIATLPVWAFREKRPILPKRYIHSLRFFLDGISPRKYPTTFFLECTAVEAVYAYCERGIPRTSVEYFSMR